MNNKSPSVKLLGLLALLCATLVLSACPRGVRPPRPHIPRPVLPMDSMLQLERQKQAMQLSGWIVQAAAVEKV